MMIFQDSGFTSCCRYYDTFVGEAIKLLGKYIEMIGSIHKKLTEITPGL